MPRRDGRKRFFGTTRKQRKRRGRKREARLLMKEK